MILFCDIMYIDLTTRLAASLFNGISARNTIKITNNKGFRRIKILQQNDL